jgi:hypothetical protein
MEASAQEARIIITLASQCKAQSSGFFFIRNQKDLSVKDFILVAPIAISFSATIN